LEDGSKLLTDDQWADLHFHLITLKHSHFMNP